MILISWNSFNGSMCFLSPETKQSTFPATAHSNMRLSVFLASMIDTVTSGSTIIAYSFMLFIT